MVPLFDMSGSPMSGQSSVRNVTVGYRVSRAASPQRSVAVEHAFPNLKLRDAKAHASQVKALMEDNMMVTIDN